jgi:hypothetical protein
MTHDRQVIKAQVLSNVDTVDVAQVMSTRIEDTQQQWIDHQQERFRIQLQRSQTANSTRQSSPQSTSSIHPKERQATSQHASLRQLDHIERLLRTYVHPNLQSPRPLVLLTIYDSTCSAGESFPSSSTEASDYLVATQCYSMVTYWSCFVLVVTNPIANWP